VGYEKLTPPIITRTERIWASSSPGIPDEVIVPMDDNKQLMAPLERETGRPLPIISDHLDQKANKHHVFYYERFYKEGSLGQQAVRLSSLQLTNSVDHRKFHDEFPGGTAFPTTSGEEFNLTILGGAGYISRFGVRMRRGGGVITEMSKKETQKLRTPRIFSTETSWDNLNKMADFLLEYSIDQSFDDVKEKYIEEFLSIKQADAHVNARLQKRKQHLAMKLTNTAIAVAVDPIEPLFKEARLTQSFSAGQKPPVSAWHAVKRIAREREPIHFGTLEKRLATQYLGHAATA